MGTLRALDDAFNRLVFDQAARDRLAAGDWDALGFDPATRRALHHIDIAELQRLGRALRRGLASGSLGGIGLTKAFDASLARLAVDGDAEAVLDRFIASSHLGEVDAVGLRSGVSVAEAFHDWAGRQLTDPAARSVLQHEFVAAVLTALAGAARPGFLVRTRLVRETPRGHMALLDATRALSDPDDQPHEGVVHFAAVGKYLSGRISSPVAAVLLTSASSCPPWARQLAESLEPEQATAIRTGLTDRGMV